jgi:hypothetical protein
MRLRAVLSHSCRYYHVSKVEFPNKHTFYSRAGSPWDPEASEFEYSADLSAVVRAIVLECGENPDTITVQEMNGKHHRFGHFGRDTVSVLNWLQVVSFGTRLLDGPMPDL